MRVAFCGASGTGKSTLAEWLSKELDLEFNPVGSRSVAKAMGFDNPYDVDVAGKRREFQARLLDEKVQWEAGHESFVTDRTTFDNLLYTSLHDVHCITNEQIEKAIEGFKRYDIVFYCPVTSFCDTAGDPNRVSDMAYHRIYDAALSGFLADLGGSRWVMIPGSDLGERKKFVLDHVGRVTHDGDPRHRAFSGIHLR